MKTISHPCAFRLVLRTSLPLLVFGSLLFETLFLSQLVRPQIRFHLPLTLSFSLPFAVPSLGSLAPWLPSPYFAIPLPVLLPPKNQQALPNRKTWRWFDHPQIPRGYLPKSHLVPRSTNKTFCWRCLRTHGETQCRTEGSDRGRESKR